MPEVEVPVASDAGSVAPSTVTASSPATAARPAATGPASVASVGVALPAARVSTAEVAARLGIDPEWIVSRTGIHERPVAAPGETLTELATAAAERALDAAALPAAALDLVIVATFTGDRLLPNTAPLVADAIGARAAGSFDVGAACTGFLTGLAVACGQVESGRARHVLVVGADLVSRVTDPADRKTAGLFADGAGAVVVRPAAAGAGQIGPILLRTDASRAECIVADHEERLLRMHGQDTFRAAVDALPLITTEALADAGLGIDDIDLFVYHQANARITSAVGERLGLPVAKVVDCIARLGNSSAATLPLALHHAAVEGRLRPGSRVLVAAFGAGFVWGAGVLTWDGAVAT